MEEKDGGKFKHHRQKLRYLVFLPPFTYKLKGRGRAAGAHGAVKTGFGGVFG